MIKNRVKAFTILEMTVAMLLTAIAVGITYTAWSIVSRSYGSFSKKNENMEMLMRLDKLLQKDFVAADTITKTTAGIIIRKDTATIRYEFQPDFTVRTGIITDTFKFKNSAIRTAFENQPVIAISPINELNRIDDLALSVSFENEKIPYHYHKEYSSANLIERNPNAIN